MKKLAAAALTITMALSMSTPAYATEIGGLTNGSRILRRLMRREQQQRTRFTVLILNGEVWSIRILRM